MTRAALVAFGTLGTGSLAVLPACSSSSSAAPAGGGETSDSGVTATPFYGSSPIGLIEDASPGGNDAGTGVTTDAGGNEGSDAEIGNPMPLYGAPAIHPDAGDEIMDASEDHLSFVALYGATPH